MARAGIDPTHFCRVICIWTTALRWYEASASWFKLSIRSSSLCLILETDEIQNDFYQRWVLLPDSVIDSEGMHIVFTTGLY